MTARVMVGGVWLDTIGVVGSLEDSTIWREQGYSGDYEASWTWGVSADFQAPWFRARALVQIIEAGVEVWRGLLGEPQPGEVMRCVAYGSGSDAVNFLVGNPEIVTLDGTVDGATAAGMTFTRATNTISSTARHLGEYAEPMTLAVALDRFAATEGKVWWVSRGELSMRTEPPTTSWQVAPGGAYLGTTDEVFATTLVGTYVSGLDADGNPSTWAKVTSTDADAAAKWGVVEQPADLTSLGLLVEADAQNILDNILTRTGVRMAWTNGFEMTETNSWASNGVSAPLAVRAGQRVTLTGLSDARTSTAYHGAVEVTLGKVRRIHAERRVVCEPVGMIARDWSATVKPQTIGETRVWRFSGAA